MQILLSSIINFQTSKKKHFYMYVLSVNGMLGKEAQFVLATLSRLMDAKLDEPIFYVTVWVKVGVVIMFARLYYRVLCVN